MAVSLDSSLRQKSLCPGEEVATFLCTTNCTRVHWRINERLLAFDSEQIGDSKRARNNYASLLRCSESEGCISILNVAETTPTMTRVECSNGSNNSPVESMVYYHGVAGEYCKHNWVSTASPTDHVK